MKRRKHTVSASEAKLPLAVILSRALELPDDQARALVQTGAVYVNGRRVAKVAPPLREGDTVLVVLEERGQSVLAAPHADGSAPDAGTGPGALAPLRVLYEDEAVLAVDKPPHVDAQPSAGRVDAGLLAMASAYLGREAGLVHRLDRETSGVTVFGKTPDATRALAAEFREGTARKRYLAACGPGLAERGAIDWPLSKDPSRPGRYRASRNANGVPAMTEWTRLFASKDYCLVALYPRTGRTHQLRAHLTALGCPILGDSRYGGARTLGGRALERCLLHAEMLVLRHPLTKHPLRLVAPVPEDLAALFREAQVVLPSTTESL